MTYTSHNRCRDAVLNDMTGSGSVISRILSQKQSFMGARKAAGAGGHPPPPPFLDIPPN